MAKWTGRMPVWLEEGLDFLMETGDFFGEKGTGWLLALF